jgi:hypothetical protein
MDDDAMDDDAVDDAVDEDVDMGDVFRGLATEPLADGLTVESAFVLVKGLDDEDHSITWAGRSGGVAISTEELLGALEGLVCSIRRDLASDWEA